MRFDDSLTTVLASDLGGDAGVQAAWRQLADLVGRGRAAADAATLDRLRAMRAKVPVTVRGASARALALGSPPAALVALFAEDELPVAAPVLRTATLADDEWLALLPRLDARGRSVLRHRRDLSPAVRRGLDSFGAADFVLPHDGAVAPTSDVSAPTRATPDPVPAVDGPEQRKAEPETAVIDAQVGATTAEPVHDREGATGAPATQIPTPRFEIADIIARLDGFSRERPAEPAPVAASPAQFLFETDAAGIVRWVEGVARGALVGRDLSRPSAGSTGSDAVVAGALRRRDRFADARLEIGGDLPASGSWRLSGTPLFDPASGRFVGMRGVGRRARADQQASPAAARRSPAADSLRQLVHELRTPANAIMGFAELIESELLGPVPIHYKAQAGMIRDEAGGLVDAIEDLDTAARIEGRALELRPGRVAPAALVERIASDLRPLAFLRGVDLVLDLAADMPMVAGDERAVERLMSRLLSALVAAGTAGELIGVALHLENGRIALAIDRPAALDTDTEAALFSLDDGADERPGAPLLGIGFTLRLARNLAAELGGALAISPERLTLRLPVASDHEVHAAAI